MLNNILTSGFKAMVGSDVGQNSSWPQLSHTLDNISFDANENKERLTNI